MTVIYTLAHTCTQAHARAHTKHTRIQQQIVTKWHPIIKTPPTKRTHLSVAFYWVSWFLLVKFCHQSKKKKKKRAPTCPLPSKPLSQTPLTTAHHTTTSPSSKPSTQKDPPIPDTPHHNPSHYNTPTAGPLCGCWFCQCKHLRWVRKEKTKKKRQSSFSSLSSSLLFWQKSQNHF